jgi:hypothetical protein
MKSSLMLLLGIFFCAFSNVLALGKCEIAGEAIAFEETIKVEKSIGTEKKLLEEKYIKIGFCEYDLEKKSLQPLRCFRPQQLHLFLDSVEKTPGLNNSLWINLKTLDFQDRDDLNTKMTEFVAKYPNQEICPSGLITSPASKKKIEDSANYLAELYNRREGPLSSNNLDLLPTANSKSSKQK